MFDFNIWMIVIIIFFGGICSLQDILDRRVRNYASWTFLLFSLIVGLFNYSKIVLFEIFVILIFTFLSFLMYYKGFWGAADGKVLIASTILLVTGFDLGLFLIFIVNLFVFYVLGVNISLFNRFKLMDFYLTLKSISYLTILLQSLIVLFLGGVLFKFVNFSFDSIYFISTIIILKVLLIMFLSDYIKKYILKFSFTVQVVFDVILFCVTFFLIGNWFFLYLILLFLIRVYSDVLTKLSDERRAIDKYKGTPFIPYIFVSLLFTIIMLESFVSLIYNFFF